ncbi:MAG: hypothetical protein QM704_27290 [Anaeromyxobacteraceae bacterium]
MATKRDDPRPTHHDPQRDRELEHRRENEAKDLAVEGDHTERPLEGLSGAHTTWTEEQDDRQAGQVHGHDEARSRRASEEQIPGRAPQDPDPPLPHTDAGEDG